MILAAGRGTRLLPLTLTRSKPMIPVANRPLIMYPLESLSNAGISNVTIVAGENRRELELGLDELNPPARLTYATQDSPQGLAHAVASARAAMADSEFALLFCDNLFSAPLTPALQDWRTLVHEHRDLAALIHVLEVDDPRAFGVAELDGSWVVRLEEKPARPRSHFAVVGIDIFKPVIFEAIARIKPSARGELEITDAIQELLNMGYRVYARKLDGFWFDTGTFADLIRALAPVMDQRTDYAIVGTVEDCIVSGRLAVDAGARLSGCRISGPVVIGAGAELVDCQLGPYVAVGAGCRLESCKLDQTQVYPGTARRDFRASYALVDHQHALAPQDTPVGQAADRS